MSEFTDYKGLLDYLIKESGQFCLASAPDHVVLGDSGFLSTADHTGIKYIIDTLEEQEYQKQIDHIEKTEECSIRYIDSVDTTKSIYRYGDGYCLIQSNHSTGERLLIGENYDLHNAVVWLNNDNV